MNSDPKTFILEICVKTLQVAKTQYEELKVKLFEIHSDLQPEQLESQDHPFLKIPDKQEELDLEFVIKYLKKYHVTLKYMSNESPVSEDFQQSLREAESQVLQLLACIKQALPFLREDLEGDTIDEGEPIIPEDLKVESEMSARQRRDFIVVRNYNRLLKTVEDVINRYLI